MADGSRGSAPRGGAAPARRRRPLGPGLTAFLVVDVLLVLTFLVLLGLWLSDGSEEEPQAAPSPTAPVEETPEESAPAEPTENSGLTDFQLPSGNIYCSMTEDSATCTIVDFSYEPPPPPEGCAGTAGHVLTVSAGGPASFACVEGDVAPPPADLPVLDYGQGSTIGEMTCLSSRNGAFCRHDPSGAGFSVARAGTNFF